MMRNMMENTIKKKNRLGNSVWSWWKVILTEGFAKCVTQFMSLCHQKAEQIFG